MQKIIIVTLFICPLYIKNYNMSDLRIVDCPNTEIVLYL